MATSATDGGRRGFNPFDSDVEDDALDPVSSHFSDDEDDMDVVDFKGFKKKKKKPKEAQLKGDAQSVTVLDDEAKGDAEVIGQVWEAEEKGPSAPAVSMRFNNYRSENVHERASPLGGRSQSASARHAKSVQQTPVADFAALTVRETAKRIVQGKPYILEYHHKLEEKEKLLLEVIGMHDGNAILTVLLFLKRTLRENIFLMMVLRSEVAENHYVSYLRQLGDFEQLERFYSKILRTRRAGMLMYRRHCLNSASSGSRVQGLEKCIGYFSTFEDADVTREVPFLKEELKLLKEVQIPMQRRDDEAERKQYAIFVQFPRSMAVTSVPLLVTLFYSCLYHFLATEKEEYSPERLRKDYKLTDHQYLWMAVGARSKVRDYKSIEEKLLTVTGWFGRKNQTAAIGFEKVAELLRKYRAPEDEVVKYLRKADDSVRLEAAMKLDCPMVVIESLKEKRDRVGLSQYRDRLPQHSALRREADQLLINSTIRWKN